MRTIKCQDIRLGDAKITLEAKMDNRSARAWLPKQAMGHCLPSGIWTSRFANETEVRLNCDSGSLWITAEDGKDYLIRGGESLSLKVTGLLVVQSMNLISDSRERIQLAQYSN